MISAQAIVPVHFPYRDDQIDADCTGSGPGEKSGNDQQATQELGKRRNIAEPRRQAESGDHVDVIVQVVEYILVAVGQHDGAEGETHHQQSQGLKAIEIAQESFTSGTE